MGELVPVLAQEILPGDTIKNNVNVVIRTTSPLLRPIMDQMYLDLHFFFVPNRIVWEHWKEFLGENNESAWVQQDSYRVPVVFNVDESPQTISVNTVGDHMGLPVNGGPLPGINALPFRAFAKIWNEWWRDENSEDPVLVHIGDEIDKGFNNQSWSPNNYTGKLPKVNKF